MAVFGWNEKLGEGINGQSFVTHFAFQVPEEFEWKTYRILREKGMLGRYFNLRKYHDRETHKTPGCWVPERYERVQ